MIAINSQSILAMGAMAFSVIIPLWAIWDEFFKRRPYISEVRQGVDY